MIDCIDQWNQEERIRIMKYDQTYQSMKDIRRCNIEYIDDDEGRSWR